MSHDVGIPLLVAFLRPTAELRTLAQQHLLLDAWMLAARED